jgi:hypothetical protein
LKLFKKSSREFLQRSFHSLYIDQFEAKLAQIGTCKHGGTLLLLAQTLRLGGLLGEALLQLERVALGTIGEEALRADDHVLLCLLHLLLSHGGSRFPVGGVGAKGQRRREALGPSSSTCGRHASSRPDGEIGPRELPSQEGRAVAEDRTALGGGASAPATAHTSATKYRPHCGERGGAH